jgi:Protein of unknown function (DUF1326)
MKILRLVVCCLICAVGLVILPAVAAETQAKPAAPPWSMNATIIEACSCPMFCQCYFNTSPSGEHGHEGMGGGQHFCRFNNAFKVNRGSYGAVNLAGAKFWVSGDLGGDFSHGLTDWAVVTFDRATSKEQRDAIATVLGTLYPVHWNSLSTAEGEISWTASKDEAHALLDGGKTAEVALKRFPGMTSDPVVIKNLKYFGAQKNDGFVLMPNTVEAYRVGDKPYEFKGTNGFMITFDVKSPEAAKMPAKAGGR